MKAHPWILPEDPGEPILGGGSERFVLRGRSAHHLRGPLRVRPGARVVLGDGMGAVREAVVREVGKEDLALDWAGPSEHRPAPARPLRLALAAIEMRDLEAALVGATEAGASAFSIFRASRSTWAGPDPASGSWSRLVRLVRGACEQSRRAWIPTLELEADLGAALEGSEAVVYGDPAAGRGRSADRWFRSCPVAERARITLAVGPEGGWTDPEREALAALGAEPIWLGPHVLRARTAAVVGTAAVVVATRQERG